MAAWSALCTCRLIARIATVPTTEASSRIWTAPLQPGVHDRERVEAARLPREDQAAGPAHATDQQADEHRGHAEAQDQISGAQPFASRRQAVVPHVPRDAPREIEVLDRDPAQDHGHRTDEAEHVRRRVDRRDRDEGDGGSADRDQRVLEALDDAVLHPADERARDQQTSRDHRRDRRAGTDEPVGDVARERECAGEKCQRDHGGKALDKPQDEGGLRLLVLLVSGHKDRRSDAHLDRRQRRDEPDRPNRSP